MTEQMEPFGGEIHMQVTVDGIVYWLNIDAVYIQPILSFKEETYDSFADSYIHIADLEMDESLWVYHGVCRPKDDKDIPKVTRILTYLRD